MFRALFALLVFPLFLFPQKTQQPDKWQPFRIFDGSWKGAVDGRSGEGVGSRSYEFILNGKFLFCKNKAVFQPSGSNPKGEVHEDWGMFSYDQAKNKFIFRQFHTEGFVNEYVLEALSINQKKMIFVTERIENLPSGWRARLIFTIQDENNFTELFELAEPAKDFQVCSENRWKRSK